jgi:hypothetical protein
MVYIGGLKKSLLQSCPYLVVVLLPLLRIIRRHGEYGHLSLLFLIPVIFTSFYSYHALHGGLALNLRLFVQILPFTSILSAYAWRELTGTLHWSWTRMSVVMLLLSVFTIAYFFFLSPSFRAIDQQEFFYLTEPLLLALFLVILLIVREKVTRSSRYVLSCAAVAAFLIAMIWSGLVAFFYDYPLVRRIRQYNVDVASRAAKFVSDDSILFATFVDPFFLLIEHGRVRIANPANDNFHDFPALIEFHLNAGHAVYGAFDSQQWNALRKRGLLDPREFDIVPLELFSHCILGQIIVKSGSGSIRRVSAQVFRGQTDIGSSHTFLFLHNRSFGNY